MHLHHHCANPEYLTPAEIRRFLRTFGPALQHSPTFCGMPVHGSDSRQGLHELLKTMQVERIVDLLIQERDRLDRAIEALQEPIKRRGRRPKGAAPPVEPAAKKKATA